jgi:integrase
VLLYENYLSLIPRTGPLDRKPLETVASYGPKFGANTILVNKMSQIFKIFYAEAGIDTTERNISNHSGRVTSCTRLYNGGFTDKAVRSRSNHRSNAVHTYQREQFTLLSDISDTLGAPAPQIVKTENTSASTCNIKSEPCIENETRLREAEGIL